MKKTPFIRLLPLFFLFSFCFLYLPRLVSGEIIDGIVAVVNSDIVTLSDLEKEEQLTIEQLKLQNPASSIERERKKIRTEVLNRIIDQKLAEQEAKRLGLTVSDAEVDGAIERIMQDYGVNRDELAENLKRDGFTMERYRSNIKDQIQRIKIGQAVKSKIVINEDRLREYYKNNQQNYTTRKKYKVQHLVLKISGPEEKRAVLEKAENIHMQLKRGVDFTALARQFSTYSTASEGGDLGYILKDEMAPYMMDIIPKLKIGEISPVVETPIGLQIFKVMDIVESKEKSFDEVRDEIYRILFEQDSNTRFASWIKELRNKSHIELLLDPK